MPDLTTAFEITRGSNGIWSELWWRLAIGIVALLIGVVGLRRRWRQRGSWFTWLPPLLVTAWSFAWIVMHDFPGGFRHVSALTDAYQKGQYDVVEGDVVVLHRQPVSGHTKGDVIRVGGTTFEIDHFLATPAYHDTIAHGGVLKDGVRARIYHRDGAILRVDVQKK